MPTVLIIAIIFWAGLSLLAGLTYIVVAKRSPQSSQAKRFVVATIISGIGIALIVDVAGIVMMQFLHAKTGTTTPRAVQIIQAEGLDKINKEAEHIFSDMGTNNSRNYMAPWPLEKKDAPTISDLHIKLGEYIGPFIETIPEYSKLPMIIVPFGSHFHYKSLYISDPREPFDVCVFTNDKSFRALISTNMFIAGDAD